MNVAQPPDYRTPTRKRVVRNSATCALCGDKIVSEHRHDMKWCKCGEIMVDGGKAYIRRGAKTSLDNIVDTSIEDYPTQGPRTKVHHDGLIELRKREDLALYETLYDMRDKRHSRDRS